MKKILPIGFFIICALSYIYMYLNPNSEYYKTLNAITIAYQVYIWFSSCLLLFFFISLLAFSKSKLKLKEPVTEEKMKKIRELDIVSKTSIASTLFDLAIICFIVFLVFFIHEISLPIALSLTIILKRLSAFQSKKVVERLKNTCEELNGL